MWATQLNHRYIPKYSLEILLNSDSVSIFLIHYVEYRYYASLYYHRCWVQIASITEPHNFDKDLFYLSVQGFPPPQSETASRLGLFSRPGDTRQPSYGDRLMQSQQLSQDYRARTQANNAPRFGDTMWVGKWYFHVRSYDLCIPCSADCSFPPHSVLRSRIAGGDNSSYFGTPSRIFDEHKQSLVKGKRDFVHVLLKRNKTFVTVTDVRGNKKTGASAGCLEDKKGRSRLSKYATEATAEHVGRAARKVILSFPWWWKWKELCSSIRRRKWSWASEKAFGVKE